MYYAQKYSIEMTLLPLFSEPIEAWIYGATVRAVYKLHRGQEYISWSDIPESRINKLSEQHKRIILNTLEKYTELSTKIQINCPRTLPHGHLSGTSTGTRTTKAC